MKQLTYILSASMLLFASCSKELGKLPENAKVDGNTILDQKTAVVALNGVYYRFANVQAGNNVTDWGANETYPGFFSGFLGYGYGETNEERNEYNVQGDYFWTYSYSIINAANGVIGAVDELPDSKFTGDSKKNILAEARFLRAYGNTKLLSYYGQWWDLNSKFGVLLRTELVALGNVPKARSTVAESYTSILEDLDYAIANGPDLTDNSYATKWTAMALKMRVLLMHGQTADYTEAITLADQIIGSGKFNLEPKLIDLFRTKGMASKEVMLGVRPQQNQETYYYNVSKQYWPGASSLYVALQGFKDLLQNDPRNSWMVGSENDSRDDSYYFTKYIAEGSTPSQVTESAYPFRLSEVYLMKAEAIVRSGGTVANARTVLKEVMTKAEVTDFTAVDNAATPDAMLEQIWMETARNLTGEDGQEWLAMLRLPFEKVKELKPLITDKVQYILPVPRTELLNNPQFGDQNPGYSR
ncbi:RagB/SusD family nutrient uptake outer membrane protein [Pseudoflavitalea rhizosphaerae]|uniref:RagB/SusD family nutrient uptake outer membrane protein n=1 Tax=Pseudoflavitalea rhizosphaerae TaxID=1884793 RepID=UPI000F8CC82D|nr:RagB/SusD family nutrient uptake outer membrane protein [Pseudoflavitalea rhizosphaerae]